MNDKAIMTAKHTPTPWHVGTTRKDATTVLCHQGILAEVYGRRSDREADAAFIVHACNAHDELVAALEVIAGVLECPRDRLGRLDIAATQGEAREALRLLAVKYGATGGKDYMDQCAKVARAVLAKVRP